MLRQVNQMTEKYAEMFIPITRPVTFCSRSLQIRLVFDSLRK